MEKEFGRFTWLPAGGYRRENREYVSQRAFKNSGRFQKIQFWLFRFRIITQRTHTKFQVKFRLEPIRAPIFTKRSEQ